MNKNSIFRKIYHYFRQNALFRSAVVPVLQLKRLFKTKLYYKTEDSKYIRSLKNKYEGKRCFIIGNGPSLIPDDLELIKNEYSIAFNRIFNIFSHTSWRPNVYMTIDPEIYNSVDAQKIESDLVLISNKRISKKWKSILGVNAREMNLFGKNNIHKEKAVMESVSKDVSKYFTIAESVSCNGIELAIYLGFKEIVLIGFDHKFAIEIKKDGRVTVNKNIQGHFKEDDSKMIYRSNIDSLTESFMMINDYAKNNGIKIYNATRGGNLSVFERRAIESFT